MSPTPTDPARGPARRHRSRHHQLARWRGATRAAPSASSTCRRSPRPARSPGCRPCPPSSTSPPTPNSRPARAAALERQPDAVAGVFARDQGALVPGAADRLGQVVAGQPVGRSHGAAAAVGCRGRAAAVAGRGLGTPARATCATPGTTTRRRRRAASGSSSSRSS